MRNLIRKVSHKLRCAPLSTVNFARKPWNPVGGTISSAGSAVFAASVTMSLLRLQSAREKSNCQSLSVSALQGITASQAVSPCFLASTFQLSQQICDVSLQIEPCEIIDVTTQPGAFCHCHVGGPRRVSNSFVRSFKNDRRLWRIVL